MVHSYLPNKGKCFTECIFVSPIIFTNGWLRINQIHSHLLSHEHIKVKYKCPWQHHNYRKCFRRKKYSLEQGLCKIGRKSTESIQNMGIKNQNLGKEIELGARRVGGSWTGGFAGKDECWCWED